MALKTALARARTALTKERATLADHLDLLR
jgi:hypothetical protein